MNIFHVNNNFVVSKLNGKAYSVNNDSFSKYLLDNNLTVDDHNKMNFSGIRIANPRNFYKNHIKYKNITNYIKYSFWNMQQISDFFTNINQEVTMVNFGNKNMNRIHFFMEPHNITLTRKNYYFKINEYNADMEAWLNNIKHTKWNVEYKPTINLSNIPLFCTNNNSIFIENSDEAALFKLTWGNSLAE